MTNLPLNPITLTKGNTYRITLQNEQEYTKNSKKFIAFSTQNLSLIYNTPCMESKVESTPIYLVSPKENSIFFKSVNIVNLLSAILNYCSLLGRQFILDNDTTIRKSVEDLKGVQIKQNTCKQTSDGLYVCDININYDYKSTEKSLVTIVEKDYHNFHPLEDSIETTDKDFFHFLDNLEKILNDIGYKDFYAELVSIAVLMYNEQHPTKKVKIKPLNVEENLKEGILHKIHKVYLPNEYLLLNLNVPVVSKESVSDNDNDDDDTDMNYNTEFLNDR